MADNNFAELQRMLLLELIPYALIVRARIAVYGSICEQIRNKGFSTGMCCP